MYFLSEFGVPWVVICDGDALPIDKDRNYQLWEALRDLKRVEGTPDASTSFDELKALAEQGGVYTANTSATEKFEDIPVVKDFKTNHHVPGDGKVRQGRYIAARIPCPKEVEEILQCMLSRLGR